MRGAVRGRTVQGMVTTRSDETLLFTVVRERIAGEVPGHPGAAAPAAAAAAAAYESGASYRAAVECARALASCWVRHPANQAPRRGPVRAPGPGDRLAS